MTDTTHNNVLHVAALLHATVNRRRHQRLVMKRVGATWLDVTATDFQAQVNAVAKGFIAAGVNAGDRVVIMSKTRYEWTLCDFALWSIAAVPVPIYETSAVDQIEWILTDSAAVACVVETSGHAQRIAAALDRMSGIKEVWQFEPGASGVDAVTELTQRGSDIPDNELAARQSTLTPESIATLIYTSGTTGRPKGCVITHGNVLAETESAIASLPELFNDPDSSSLLLFLPLAHVFARLIQVMVIAAGVPLAHSDPSRLAKDLTAVQPTFVLSVPQVFEKMYETARRKAAANGRGAIFDRAARVAISWSEAQLPGGANWVLSLRRKFFDRLVYRKLRAAFGGKLKYAVSGGAPLGGRLPHFFRGAGITVVEGYGLTESTAAAAANRINDIRIGTVGPALQGFEVRIADDGEVLLRGGHVFTGYWNNPEATAQVLDANGWFRTGDLGSLDADGYLTITGRSKEVIVTAAGKNVSPAGLEAIMRAHPLIAQAIVIGDARPMLAALISLDPEAVRQWLVDQNRPEETPIPELVQDDSIRAIVQGAIDAANATVSRAEQVRRFTIVSQEWTEASGHMTPTMKLKRSQVLEDCADLIHEMYAKRL
ncbi:MAG: AMP-dependent synthetase/ligase [Actinomycetota bacterium]